MARLQRTQMRTSYAINFRIEDAFLTLNLQRGSESNISALCLKKPDISNLVKIGHFYFGLT